MSNDAETPLWKNPAFAWRRVADELILVPIRGHAQDLSYVYSLNDTAALIWELIDGEHDRQQICTAIETTFEVDADEAAADLGEFLAELIAIGAVLEPRP